jgi:diguanylate cyclase (GGDEF)-like protein
VEKQIRDLAYFDPLTRLPNRRLLMDRLGQALIASERSRELGALMILDLDHFKTLNDTQGHDVGDRLLVEVAQRLTSGMRQQDSVCRLGGDEFVVMLEGLGQDAPHAANQAETIAEKIRSVLNQPYSLNGNGGNFYSTTSIGLTLFRGQDASPDMLLKQADVALYQAKDAGRNLVRFFNPAMQAVIDSRMAMEAALRQALDNGEFRLYYQPQVNQHGELIGAEALLRWLPPNHDLIPPAEFIPLAEETGLILPIGQWVLDTACAQLKAWELDPRTRHLQMSVNVSARQFHQPDFVATVQHSLVSSGINPARLKLELTESVVLENIDTVIDRMQQLNVLGVSFCLDDFGTGYSSLSYLKRLPLDQVKIDQSFIRDVTEDQNDAAIVRAIMAMSQSLGLQVVAEGTETQAQRDFLLKNECVAYQGFLFCKPIPIDEWERLLG